MAQGSRVCPHCGRLNGIEEQVCYNCGKRFPGPIASSVGGLLGNFSADGFPATKLVVLLCVVVYGLMMLSDGGFKFDLGLSGAFRLSTMLRFGVLFQHLGVAEPWRLLSSVFIHFGLLHIGLNMLSLVSLGRTLEPHFGSARFLVLYLLTGVLGFVASQWWYESSPPTAGASGAIFGLVGAFVGVLVARKDPSWRRALVNNLIYAAILSFVLPANTAAHIGGFVSGIAIGALLERERNPHRRQGLMRALAAAGLVASLASVLLSARSPVWKEVRQYEEGARDL